MLDEGRKRDAAANAVLALSFAANAAQSPQALVSSGKVEAPGVANMQRLMDPRKKRKDLDLQRVSHSARNRLRTETYDDDMFRQHSKERPIDDQGYTPKSRTSSFLKKMKDLNLSQEPTKKKKKKTFKEFVEESYLDEKTFSSRDQAVKYHQENPPFDGEPYHIRRKSRSGEPEQWRPVRASKRNAQGKTRKTKSQDQTDPTVKSSQYTNKVSNITSQGKESHHRVSLDRAASLFKGKSPEEQQKIRDRHARVGVYFGNDPRNIIGLSRERHTAGKGSVHREIERMDRSIKKAGQESSKVFGAIKKLREERRNK